MRIKVTGDGPYRVTGGVPLSRQTIGVDAQGQSVEWREGPGFDHGDVYELCRCGRSGSKPFCDGSHERVGFDGTETASREPYLSQAGEQDGPEVTLTDAEPLCAFARFCDADGQVWNLVERPGHGDDVVREAGNCPSGRLVAWNLAEREPYEPRLEKSIGVVEDPAQDVSGPYWVRGGVTVEAADGGEYEVRNRVTLCRCGASANKPFCDGSHAAIGFRDGL
ncbi:iron-binding protein [Actinorhabdospora filicis]|uniref:Iron-binding protein n=1 Tax=Actinorhabdospora filicis TaxID=1785913 RepID=A0A9W6SIC2_9ACTN|nr:CDGSH iron-sulfur domain-containing protein [Actinorhabdospora filicis]GLZ77624.1 iron-binding protein [Actinorhabdospora filicis]